MGIMFGSWTNKCSHIALIFLFLGAINCFNRNPPLALRPVTRNNHASHQSWSTVLSRSTLRISVDKLPITITPSHVNIDADELVRIFNRLADKLILLDIPEAGQPGLINCCHSGCDNCDFARIFDIMTSARSKWIPLYHYREFVDGRSHEPSWVGIFKDPQSSTGCTNTLSSISEQEFIQRVQQLQCQMSLGPPSIADAIPSEISLSQLWNAILSNSLNQDPNGETISAEDFAVALSVLCHEEHGATWVAFRRGLCQSSRFETNR